MATCTEMECNGPAVGQGLCAMHYQRSRRAGSLSPSDRVGRPPQYSEDVRRRHGGAPKLGLRLEPDLHEWVQQQGGSGWVQQLLRRAYEGDLSEAMVPGQDKTRAGFNAAQFLKTLHAAYQLKTGQPYGSMAKLLDLYQVLTLLPTARQTYTQAAFTQHLHELDRHWKIAAARTGLSFRLDAGSTAARKRSNLLILCPEDGTREHTYYGIEFFAGPVG